MASYRPVWAEVNLNSLRHNIRRIKKLTNSEIMPIVKADAYGHGAVQIVRTLREEGIQRFGVAFLEEALELRSHFSDSIIMVIGPTLPEYSEILVKEEIIPEIFQVEQAIALSEAAVKLKKNAKIHIKIDTGMGRIGFRETALEDITQISLLPNIYVEGIYTHLATADSPDLSYTQRQLNQLNKLHDRLSASGIDIPIRHAANSPAVMQVSASHYEICRPGLIVYGLNPLEDLAQDIDLLPVLSLKARISHLKTIDPGESVGYGRSFFAERSTKVATLPLGYADGLRRAMSNGGEVLIKGQRVLIIGKVCMDQTMVDVSDIENVAVGDEVTILGKDGDEAITAKELADRADTISYEILCGITKRVPRIYLNN